MSNTYFIRVDKADIPVVGYVMKEKVSDPKLAKTILISLIRTRSTKNSIKKNILDSSKLHKIRKFNKNNISTTKLEARIVGKNLVQIASTPLDIGSGFELVTYADMEYLRNCIIIINKESSEKDILVNSIVQKLLEQSPLPIPEDNLTEVAESLISELSECVILRDNQFFTYDKIVMIDVNSQSSINKIEKVMIKSYGTKQFIAEMGQAPRIESLLSMIDPKQLKLKKWKQVLDHFKGKDGFESLPFDTQQSVVWGFEVFEEKIIDIYKLLIKMSIDFNFIPFKEIAVSKFKIKFKFDINKFVSKIKLFEDGLPLFSFISLLSDKEFFKDFDNILKSRNSIMEYITSREYGDIRMGGEAMAIICQSLGLSEISFKKYQEAYIKAMDINKDSPVRYPTVKGELERNKDYSWECIDMRNVKAWFVGLETHCCQHLDSCGGSCVIYAAEHIETSGIFRVMKKGKTIAQSFFWIDISKGNFVFDNIEVLGNELRSEIMDCYELFVDELEKRKDIFGYKQVSFGAGYSDIDNSNYELAKNTSNLGNLPGGSKVYTDARSQRLIRKFKI